MNNNGIKHGATEDKPKSMVASFKDKENINPISISPDFGDLEDPETFMNHISELTGKVSSPDAKILDKLLEEIKPLDFKAIAFPRVKKMRERIAAIEKQLSKKNKDKAGLISEVKNLQKDIDGLKLNQKHYAVYSIENLLKIAKRNKWGLSKNEISIYVYNGCYWKPTDPDAFKIFLGKAAERMGVDKVDARFVKFRQLLLDQFEATAYLPTPEPEKEKVLINLKNGTLVIERGKETLRKFKETDFIKYVLPFNYDMNAKAPMFQRYLKRVLPDGDLRKVLAEYAGYVFVRNGSGFLKLEKALILYGSGHNGKSVFYDVLTGLLGKQNVSQVPLSNLTEEKGFYRAKIADTILNYASEINNRMESSVFKQLVSGEPVEACYKYQQPFTMYQYAKLMFNANELPRDVEHTNAYFRRFLIIPFDETITEEEKDGNLARKIIKNELPGVLNWALEGLARLIKQGDFTPSEKVKEVVNRFRLESDSVQLFLNEMGYTISISEWEPLKSLYFEYRSFCIDYGMRPVKKLNFSKRLKQAGVIVENGTGNKVVAYVSAGENIFQS